MDKMVIGGKLRSMAINSPWGGGGEVEGEERWGRGGERERDKKKLSLLIARIISMILNVREYLSTFIIE